MARGATSATYRDQFFSLASHDSGGGAMFNMTALAMRTAGAVNGVSQLHGEVTKQMWQSIWPDTLVRSAASAIADQRRARADVDVVRDRRAPREASRGRLVRSSRRSDVLRRRACGSPTRSSGRRASCSAPSCSTSSANGRATGGRPKTSPRPGSSRPARCSITTR